MDAAASLARGVKAPARLDRRPGSVFGWWARATVPTGPPRDWELQCQTCSSSPTPQRAIACWPSHGWPRS